MARRIVDAAAIEGLENLLRGPVLVRRAFAACRSVAERQAAIRAVAGYTPVGLKRSKRATADLRARGIVQLPEDLGVSPREANRSLLAAQDIKGLVRWSQGLYDPPPQFVDW